MHDNDIVYLISFVGIVLIYIERLCISRERSIISMVIFLSYSVPLYYLMSFKGQGGAAFTWWMYLVLFTSIHEVVLLYGIVKSYIKNH